MILSCDLLPPRQGSGSGEIHLGIDYRGLGPSVRDAQVGGEQLAEVEVQLL